MAFPFVTSLDWPGPGVGRWGGGVCSIDGDGRGVATKKKAKRKRKTVRNFFSWVKNSCGG